jgi:translation elongation factor EF-G
MGFIIKLRRMKMASALAPIFGGIVKTLCGSFLSEKLLQEVILILLRHLVESTENKVDDKILKAYEKSIAKS